MDKPLFNSTHEALLFAYNYSYQQSPKSTMSALMHRRDEESGISRGTGKGLTGLDAAAQAGFIMAGVGRLPIDQQAYITAKYGDATHECLCCGEDAHSREWKAAIDVLSNCEELSGLPKRVKLDIVKKLICGKKFNQTKTVQDHKLSETTVYRKQSNISIRISKIQKEAYRRLNEVFFEDKLLIA